MAVVAVLVAAVPLLAAAAVVGVLMWRDIDRRRVARPARAARPAGASAGRAASRDEETLMRVERRLTAEVLSGALDRPAYRSEMARIASEYADAGEVRWER